LPEKAPQCDGSGKCAASDDAISKIVAALKDTFKVEIIAPGHCTGEPTFAARRCLTASLLGSRTRSGSERSALDAEDIISYRRLAAREDPFGQRRRR
jgi:7,8-dihydropterin-6-yl-methyl-4-(beta-D-ribofuranosyl)aminobenzene 5'-phosphate synthase